MTAEDLRKALAKLERERDWEKTQRQEMELVLQGLRVLRGDLSTKRMFFELLEVFRAILNFEDAFLLLQSDKGFLIPVSSTKPLYYGSVWKPTEFLERVLEGHATACFDIDQFPEWSQQPGRVQAGVRSALLAPLLTKQHAGILICTHSELGFFHARHVRLVERFTPLATQALANAEARDLQIDRERLQREAQVAAEKSALLEHATHAVGTGIGIWTRTDELTYCSPQLETMISNWQTPATWWKSVLNETDVPPEAECQECEGTHHIGSAEVALTCPKGEPRWFRVAFTGHNHGIDAEPGAEVILVIDITEPHQAEEARLESERRYRYLVENSRGLITTHDLEGNLLSINPAAAEMLGYRPDEMVGRSLKDFLDPSFHESFDEYLDAIQGESTASGLMVFVTKNGSRRIWMYHNSTYKESGQDPYVLGHAQDITELKRMEERLEVTQFSVDRAADSVFWIDKDGHFRYVNDEACRSLDFSRDVILSMSASDIDVSLANRRWPNFWERVKRLGSLSTESAYRAKNGRIFPVEVTINYLEFRDNEYLCAFARDITERKQIEEAIRTTTAQLEGLIENLPTGVLFEEGPGKVVMANETLCRLLEIPVLPDSLQGASSSTVLDQCKVLFPNPEEFVRRTESLIKEQKLVKNEELQLLDGRMFERDLVPIITEDHRAYLWHYRDVTERKRVEEVLRNARDDAEAANRAKSQFLAVMSHELRTPLNAILGMTELSLDTVLSREQNEFLNTIQSNSEHLLHLIDDILDLSKIEAGQMDLETKSFDPRKLVEDVAELLSARAKTKNLGLICDVDPNLPDRVLGDPGRVRQVLVNLVGNAVKFTETGEVAVRLDVSKWTAGGTSRLDLLVSDDGIGIPEKEQEHIFNLFYQADLSTTRRFGGTGLGLNISKSLVELMEGQIHLSSEPGKGSDFRVSLDFPVPTEAQPNRTAGENHLSGIKVHLTVASERLRGSLRRLLSSWGCKVQHHTPLETIEILRTNKTHPDIILLDPSKLVNQPECMDELVQEINRRQIGVLVVSPLPSRYPEHLEKLDRVELVSLPIRQTTLLQSMSATLELEQPPDVTPDAAEPKPSAGIEQAFRVLLAEDNPDNRRLARIILENEGYELDIAENGLEAFNKAKQNLYDIIIMDLMMPEMDGFQATRAIRALDSGSKNTPIVALTAHAGIGFRERCLAGGMNDYLAKPYKKSDLLAMVTKRVDRRSAILVADDSPEARDIVERFLMRDGAYRLTFACNGQEAVEAFSSQRVSLVLMDMEMPVLNGYEAARAIRETPRGAEIPIIAMTAHVGSREEKKCLDAGCTDTLRKPLSRNRLLQCTELHLGEPQSIESADTRACDKTPGTPEHRDQDKAKTTTVEVDPDIVDLIPRFLENVRRDLFSIKDLLGRNEFDQIRVLSHNMKGNGLGYGFHQISEIGEKMEAGANRKDERALQQLIDQLEQYLSRVEYHPQK
jgi:PAS domain S-box-containing protein